MSSASDTSAGRHRGGAGLGRDPTIVAGLVFWLSYLTAFSVILTAITLKQNLLKKISFFSSIIQKKIDNEVKSNQVRII